MAEGPNTKDTSMILSDQDIFSNAQAITATAASANAIDLKATGIIYGASGAMARDVGKGSKIPLLVQVVETFVSGATDGTLNIAVELDSTEIFTPDKTINLGTFLEADLVPGFQIPFDVLPNGLSLQFMRLKYTVGGSGDFTGGKLTAGIVAGVQTNG